MHAAIVADSHMALERLASYRDLIGRSDLDLVAFMNGGSHRDGWTVMSPVFIVHLLRLSLLEVSDQPFRPTGLFELFYSDHCDSLLFAPAIFQVGGNPDGPEATTKPLDEPTSEV